jgi:hypothetical protein
MQRSNILFFPHLTGILFIVYFVSMIIGTFMDLGMETSPTPHTQDIFIMHMVV